MDSLSTFPANVAVSSKQTHGAAVIYGNRFLSDQTLYEYLIEFLLVLVSPDETNHAKEAMRFHDLDKVSETLYYTVQPRMGLRRFIFFDRNKKNDAVPIDKDAYDHLIKALKDKTTDNEEEKTEGIEALQDLLFGYAVVLKKRSWCAQAMLPLCPELVFCGAMPIVEERKKLDWDNVLSSNRKYVDTKFDFKQRNFLARGGELFYLHILQGLTKCPEKKEILEKLFQEQFVEKGKKFSKIANLIQSTWEDYMEYDQPLTEVLPLSFIPENAYINIASDTIDELINILSCRMHPVKKIELLAHGVMLQILRMLCVATTNYLEQERDCWIMDLGETSGNNVKKLSTACLDRILASFTTAIGKSIHEEDNKTRFKMIQAAKNDSFNILKTKGKELQCIIPKSGAAERFSLSENCIRFLVLALIPPKDKMTVDMFLEKLYEKYRIVIGPVQYMKCNAKETGAKRNALADSFADNLEAFQAFLKATGFLRELSDATSIVMNPFEPLEV